MKVRVFGTVALGLLTAALVGFATTSQASLNAGQEQASRNVVDASLIGNADAQQAGRHVPITFPHVPY